MEKNEFPGIIIIGGFFILRGLLFIIIRLTTLDITADALILALIFITGGYFSLRSSEFGRKLIIILSLFSLTCVFGFAIESQYPQALMRVYSFCNAGIDNAWSRYITAILYVLFIYYFSLGNVRGYFRKREYKGIDVLRNQNKVLASRLKALSVQLNGLHEIIDEKDKIIARYDDKASHDIGISDAAAKEIETKQKKLVEQKRGKIGEILVKQRLITKEILGQALEYQKQSGGSITQYLLYYGYIDEKQLAQCLCTQFSVPYIPLESYDISDEIIKLVPADIAEKFWLVPVDKQGDNLMLAMIDPLDTKVIKQLEELTGYKIRPFVGIISEITHALQVYYKVFVRDGKFTMKTLPFFVDTKIYKGTERRTSLRYAAKIAVQFPMQGRYHKATTTNLSRNGFALESTAPIPIGAVLPLEINLPESYCPLPILALVQVVRRSPLKNQRSEIALKTLKISKQELDVIIEYASQFIKA